MLQNEGSKEKNPECRYPVFILDFTNFAGFLHRCPCSMQSPAENKGYSDRRDPGLDTACKRWTVSYRCSSFRRKKTSSTDLDIRDHNSFCWGR